MRPVARRARERASVGPRRSYRGKARIKTRSLRSEIYGGSAFGPLAVRLLGSRVLMPIDLAAPAYHGSAVSLIDKALLRRTDFRFDPAPLAIFFDILRSPYSRDT